MPKHAGGRARLTVIRAGLAGWMTGAAALLAAAPPATSPLLDEPMPASSQSTATVNDDFPILPDLAPPAPEPASPATTSAGTASSDTASVAFESDAAPDESAGADAPARAHAPPPAPALAPAPTTQARSDPAINASGANVDSATMRRIAERLVSLNLLVHADDAQDPALLTEAIRGFQSASGIAPTGTLDRDTIGRLVS